MWTHCMFCTRDLGRNEVLELFPVGTRLAFDPERGRLWVLCRTCGGWNLTPVEERWETIEGCERIFRETRTRVSTGELGLARLSSGLELVRVGQPLRPEFAAWRYGDELGRRRRRVVLLGAGLAGVGTGAVFGGLVGATGVLLPAVGYQYWAQHRTVTRIRDPRNRILEVRGSQLGHAFLVRASDDQARSSGWGVSVPYRGGREVLVGEEGRLATTRVIRRINWLGGSGREVKDAVQQMEDRGGPSGLLDGFVRDLAAPPGPPEFRLLTWKRLIESRGRSWTWAGKTVKGALTSLDPSKRLAFEMALQEDTERRAAEGELRLLERAWQDAEEIAAIADNLLPPPGSEEFLERHRSVTTRGSSVDAAPRSAEQSD
jgi:hypothetical protein